MIFYKMHRLTDFFAEITYAIAKTIGVINLQFRDIKYWVNSGTIFEKTLSLKLTLFEIVSKAILTIASDNG